MACFQCSNGLMESPVTTLGRRIWWCCTDFVLMDLWMRFLEVSTNNYIKFLRQGSYCRCSRVKTLLSNSQNLPSFSSILAKHINIDIFLHNSSSQIYVQPRFPMLLLQFWSIRWQMLLRYLYDANAWGSFLWDAHHVCLGVNSHISGRL